MKMKETQENPETESMEHAEKHEESDDNSSPRGVLEIPILGSDSDGSSNCGSFKDSGGCGNVSSSFDEKSEVHGRSSSGDGHGSNWRSLINGIKRRSMRRFSTIPLLSGHEVSRKKKLGRNRSAEDGIDCGQKAAAKPSWRNFSYQELAAATDGFNPEKLIGKGGHAEVYKGCLPDGQIVAVKRIEKKEKNDEDRVGDFLSELGIIAHLDHPNAAKLFGFSVDNGLHLVLRFLPHGSLATLLHGSTEPFEWDTRFKVAIGVAEGLQYLHCGCQRRIIHRDITASNILLTDDYQPQISDFGLAKWLPEKWIHHVVSPIEGTFGYMAPEYFMHGIVDEKTDVFAFGVLLLELITGRRAVDSCLQSLVIWAKPLLEKNNIKELADPRLGDTCDIVEMKRAVLTAATCVHHVPGMRPNMTRIVQLLRGCENGQVDLKQKSMGGRTVILNACDMEDYTSTTYLKDLNRHMELVME